jgi:hypothetical protein
METQQFVQPSVARLGQHESFYLWRASRRIGLEKARTIGLIHAIPHSRNSTAPDTGQIRIFNRHHPVEVQDGIGHKRYAAVADADPAANVR